MMCDIDFDEYDKKESPKYKPEEHEHDKTKKESECGKVEIKAENVYITIKCEKEKKDY